MTSYANSQRLSDRHQEIVSIRDDMDTLTHRLSLVME